MADSKRMVLMNSFYCLTNDLKMCEAAMVLEGFVLLLFFNLSKSFIPCPHDLPRHFK